MTTKLVLGVISCFVVAACSASQHQRSLPSNMARNLTVGIVQREIRSGMAPEVVAEVLGSPNIVTSSEAGRETWIYDRIGTETAYSTSSGGISALILASGSDVSGAGAPGFSYRAGAT